MVIWKKNTKAKSALQIIYQYPEVSRWGLVLGCRSLCHQDTDIWEHLYLASVHIKWVNLSRKEIPLHILYSMIPLKRQCRYWIIMLNCFKPSQHKTIRIPFTPNSEETVQAHSRSRKMKPHNSISICHLHEWRSASSGTGGMQVKLVGNCSLPGTGCSISPGSGWEGTRLLPPLAGCRASSSAASCFQLLLPELCGLIASPKDSSFIFLSLIGNISEPKNIFIAWKQSGFELVYHIFPS